MELGKEYFGNLPTNALKLDRTEPITWTPCDIRNPRIRKPGAPEEARVAVAWQGASWSDPDFFPLMVIQSLLGDWDYQSSGGIAFPLPSLSFDSPFVFGRYSFIL